MREFLSDGSKRKLKSKLIIWSFSYQFKLSYVILSIEEKNICYTAESKQVPQNFNKETYLSFSLGIQTSAHRKMLFFGLRSDKIPSILLSLLCGSIAVLERGKLHYVEEKSEKLNKQRMTVKWNCFLPPIFLPWIHSLDRHVVLFTYRKILKYVFFVHRIKILCKFCRSTFLVQFGIKLSMGWTATNPFHCSFQKICPLIIQWS